jgi:hypothetical protein
MTRENSREFARGARNERTVSATADYMAVGSVDREPVSELNSLLSSAARTVGAEALLAIRLV